MERFMSQFSSWNGWLTSLRLRPTWPEKRVGVSLRCDYRFGTRQLISVSPVTRECQSFELGHCTAPFEYNGLTVVSTNKQGAQQSNKNKRALQHIIRGRCFLKRANIRRRARLQSFAAIFLVKHIQFVTLTKTLYHRPIIHV